MTDLINIPPHLQQRILKLVGLMDSTLLGNDVYYELRIIDIFMQWLGEDRVAEMLKKDGYDWVKIKKQIGKVNKKVQKVKPFYDMIDDKKFAKIEKEKDKKNNFIRVASKVPLYDNPVTFMYIYFVRNTNLQQLQVKAEYYKVIEDTGFRKMDVRKTRQTDVVPTTGSV